MIKYSLMHKNDKCGTILFDENIGRITEYHDDRNGYHHISATVT